MRELCEQYAREEFSDTVKGSKKPRLHDVGRGQLATGSGLGGGFGQGMPLPEVVFLVVFGPHVPSDQ